MTEHIKTKRYLRSIRTIAEFEKLLNTFVLSDEEKKILRMYYIDKKDLMYIGDILGYSGSGIQKKHVEILQKMRGLEI